MPAARGRGAGRGMAGGAARGRGGPRFAAPQNRFAVASFPSPPLPSAGNEEEKVREEPRQMIESGTADDNYVLKSPKNGPINPPKEPAAEKDLDPLAFFDQLGSNIQVTKPKVIANPFAEPAPKDNSNPLDFFDNLIQPKEQAQVPAVEVTAQPSAPAQEEEKNQQAEVHVSSEEKAAPLAPAMIRFESVVHSEPAKSSNISMNLDQSDLPNTSLSPNLTIALEEPAELIPNRQEEISSVGVMNLRE